MRRSSRKSPIIINKLTFLIVACALVTLVLIGQLFNLQIFKHDYFQEIATREQHGYAELPAQRGEIIIQDYHSNEEFLLGTNITLNLLFADPSLIDDPQHVTEMLTPLIFDLEEAREMDNERIEEQAKNLPPDITNEEKAKLLKPLTDTELEEKFKQDLLTKISAKKRPQILLATNLEEEKLSAIKSSGANGIEIVEDDVYAYPPQISNTTFTAQQIADYVEIPSKKLAQILKGENRYVVLKRKLQPEISEEIERLSKEDEFFTGIGLHEEYFRFYPEKSLAANIIGYVSNDNIGQYGIESSFNTQLQGKAGRFQTKRDSIGRQITVGESILEPAVDGDDIVLTIDRSIQLKTEKILEEAVKEYRADSGQIIIMNPQTGSITAMAHYPSYDPNEFGEAFKKTELTLSQEEKDDLYPSPDKGIYYLYTNAVTLAKYLVFEEEDKNGNKDFYRYENFVGPEVYHNKIVSWPYEPGSVFKPLIMAMAIDDGDVTPNTTYNDTGPIEVDFNVYTQKYDFTIRNAENYYGGLVDMTTVLARSLNTGMTFVAKKIGGALMYSYLKKFGFLDRTDIEFDSETKGKINYFEDWTESELATHAFGQGLTVTMIQLANAYCSLANGGILMQPHIVKEIRHDDNTVSKIEPHEIRRVISEDTSNKITAMLVSAVEVGVAKTAQVNGHFVAGKTGTSQTYKHGKALSGPGTTITSFAGYGPIDDPQFVIIVKLDHPQSSEWGAATAAPTFKKLAEYLFNYYNIPPDKPI